jgi:hypothetical protein
MPKNCSTDVEAVIGYIDEVFTGSNQTAINYIKDLFGLGVLTHLDDVVSACKCSDSILFCIWISYWISVRINLGDWQSLQPDSGSGTMFYKFCDALEVKNGVSAPASGWGVDHALSAWGKFFSGNYTQMRALLFPCTRRHAIISDLVIVCGTDDIESVFHLFV